MGTGAEPMPNFIPQGSQAQVTVQSVKVSQLYFEGNWVTVKGGSLSPPRAADKEAGVRSRRVSRWRVSLRDDFFMVVSL
mgnify:CR=1 FL=1